VSSTCPALAVASDPLANWKITSALLNVVGLVLLQEIAGDDAKLHLILLQIRRRSWRDKLLCHLHQRVVVFPNFVHKGAESLRNQGIGRMNRAILVLGGQCVRVAVGNAENAALLDLQNGAASTTAARSNPTPS